MADVFTVNVNAYLRSAALFMQVPEYIPVTLALIQKATVIEIAELVPKSKSSNAIPFNVLVKVYSDLTQLAKGWPL